MHLHGKERKTYFEKFEILKLLVLSLMTPFPFELQPAGELQGIMLKIYCERCWLILEDIEIIFLKKNDMWLCSGAFCKCNGACFRHVILILHS